jgi:hypothetical protein
MVADMIVDMKKITTGIIVLVFIGMLIAMYLVGKRTVPILENLPQHYQYLIVIIIFAVLFILYMGGAFFIERRFLRRKY